MPTSDTAREFRLGLMTLFAYVEGVSGGAPFMSVTTKFASSDTSMNADFTRGHNDVNAGP